MCHDLAGRVQSSAHLPGRSLMNEPITAGALLEILPEVAGSALSIRLNTSTLGPFNRLCAFALGVAMAHFVGAAVAEWFELSGEMGDAARFVSGVFGLNIAAEANKQIPEIFKAAIDRIGGKK